MLVVGNSRTIPLILLLRERPVKNGGENPTRPALALFDVPTKPSLPEMKVLSVIHRIYDDER